MSHNQAIEITPSMNGYEITQWHNSPSIEAPVGQQFGISSVLEGEINLPTDGCISAFALLDSYIDIEASQDVDRHNMICPDNDRLISQNFSQVDFQGDHSLRDSPLLLSSSETPNSKGNICLEDADAEAIIEPLQLMREHLQMSSNGSKFQWQRSQGSTLSDLYALINSTWLSFELEALLGWSYEASAKASLRRRISSDKGKFHFSSEDHTKTDDHSAGAEGDCEQMVRQGPCPVEKRTKFTSYWLSLLPKGAIAIRLKTLKGGPSALRDPQSPWVLSITSMPKATHRTKGISAKFIKPMGNAEGLRIPSHITTINLIPEDSPIIHCISNNDYLGVKKMFDSKEVHPKDVDPWGFSLLSVS